VSGIVHPSTHSHDSLEHIRVCPGQHVANWSIFINTALIFWAFRLSENPAAKIDMHAFSDTVTVHAAIAGGTTVLAGMRENSLLCF
jgi:hypothetical protein